MRNNASARRAWRALAGVLVILATLAQGILAEEAPEPEVIIEDIAADTGADETTVELADGVIPEDALPSVENIAPDGLDLPDLMDEGLTLEAAPEEAPVEAAPDTGGLATNDGETTSFDYIAYSAVNDINDAPINTAEHYLKCCSPEYAFTSIKGDLQLTSDRRIVMCHDPGFTLSESGRIKNFNASNMVLINSLTYAQCMALRYERQYLKQDVGVCDFETYIGICAQHNKDAFITIRDRNIAELLDEMMPIIYRYNMQSRCVINSFTLKSLELVRAYDPSIRLSLVIEGGVPAEAVSDAAARLGNCLLTLFSYPGSMYGGIERLIENEDKLAYAREKGLRLYSAVLTRADYTQQLTDLGISGAQFKESPFDPKHDWGEPAYTWSASYGAVTATRVCRYDAKHKETERAKTTCVSTPAACEAPGAMEYTAVFTNPAFSAQTKVVEVPPLGHHWNPPTYTWAEDDSAVTAVHVCANDETHIESETAATQAEVIRPATEKRAGLMAYTAAFSNPAFEAQTKRVEIPKLPVNEAMAKGGLYLLNHDDRTATFMRPKNDAARVLAVSDTVRANDSTYTVTAIADESCSGMSALTTVIVGANVKSIGDRAFAGCPKLKTVKGGDRVTAIGSEAFCECASLAALPGLPKLERVKASAFKGCKALREITLGTRLKSIGRSAFQGCGRLKTIAVRTRLLTRSSVGADAFRDIHSAPRVLCPKRMLEAYRNLFKRKGLPKGATFDSL